MSDTDIKWRVYYPENGETAEDAVCLTAYRKRRIIDAEDAAEIACEYDYNENGGDYRDGEAFIIVIIDPNGNEHQFHGRHEAIIIHTVESTNL